MATGAPEHTAIKSFFLAIGFLPHQFLRTILNGMNYHEMELHSQSASFSLDITHLSRYDVFYCIYNPQNFIPKNLDNALMEFVQTLPTSRRLLKVQASLSDFRENVLMLRNTTKLINVMTSLRCYDKCDVNITLVITNFDLYLKYSCGNRFSVALLMAT